MRSLVAALAAAALTSAVALSPSVAAPPTGKLAFAEFGTGFHPTIWISGLSGAHARKLASNADTPVIAPDGSAVVYQSEPTTRTGEPALRIVSTDGTNDHLLATNLRDLEPPAWSPDSVHVAAVVGPEIGGPRRLVVIDVHTGAKRTIATGFFDGVSWAPDGSKLVYAREPHSLYPGPVDLYVASPTGGTPKQLTHDHRSAYPIWGAKAIAFQRYNATQPRNDNPKANLATIKPDGSGLHQLTHGVAPRFLTGLVPLWFSADGTRLLAEFGGQDTSYAETVNPVTGKVKLVGSHINDYIGMALSKDGSTILAAKGGYDPNGKHSVVTFPYAGGPAKVLVPNAYFATWTR